MAYDRQFIRITWGFTVTGTDEIADTTLSYSSAAGWTGAAAALAEIDGGVGIGHDSATNLQSLLETSGLNWADYSELRTVKFAAVGTDGSYLADPSLYEDSTPATGSATQVAPQETCVLSLRSGFTIGKGNYGRMYLPHTRLTLDAGTPKAAGGTRDNIAIAGKAFVNAITALLNTVTTATIFPVIMSQTGITSKGVTAVAVGDVIDTQRRRRNRIPEVYSVQNLA